MDLNYYYPSTCEFESIVNATIAACDPMDGKTDGVVARSDLCALNFNMSSIIGTAYYCAAETASSSLGLGFGKRQAAGSSTSSTPAQNDTVTAEAVAVAQAIVDGLHDTQGRRAYISYQMGAGSMMLILLITALLKHGDWKVFYLLSSLIYSV